MRPLLIALSILIFVYPLHAQKWTELNPRDHLFNNTVFATVADRTGNVYAAGKFTDSSGQYYVATLINAAWVPLGGAQTLRATGPLYALALDSAGNLYAGGAFTGSSGLGDVAKWDGSRWTQLGSGAGALVATGQIFSIATDKAGNVYAGGEFTDFAGNCFISKWDGNSWTSLGTGTHTLPANSIIYSILPDGSGNVYVAGQFTNASGKYYVAKWNGADWNETGSGAGALNANSWINVLASDASGRIYAAGDFRDSLGNQYVASWDGAAWSELGTGPSALRANGSINSLLFDDSGRLNVAGRISDSTAGFFVSRWMGSGWSALPYTYGVWPANNTINCLAKGAPGVLYAAGDFTDKNKDHFVARFSDGNWSEPGANGTKLPTPSNPFKAIAVDTGGHVFISAGDGTAGNVPVTYRWDGGTWDQLPAMTNGWNNYVSGLAPDSAGHMYAYGSFVGGYGVALWKDTGWAVLPPPGTLAYYSISHIATDKAGQVYLSGNFTDGNGHFASMARWDGGSWHYFCTLPVYYFIVAHTATIYAAYGDYGWDTYNVARVNGYDTVSLGGGPAKYPLNANAWVQSMTLDAGGKLYAAGAFTDTAGNTYVARWDGKTWAELGTGTASLNGGDGVITGLVLDNGGNLYASGGIWQHSADYIGKWDGRAWSNMATGNMFWTQDTYGFLGRDARGTLYTEGNFTGSAGFGQYVFSYMPTGTAQRTGPVCTHIATVRLNASDDTVTDQSNPVLLTATITAGRGTNTSLVFARDRNFTQLMPGSPADSTVSLSVSGLITGNNSFYVRMRTTDACDSVITAVDSIVIVKRNPVGTTAAVNGPIAGGPNPTSQLFNLKGLDASHSYFLFIGNSQGQRLKTMEVSGAPGIAVDCAFLKQGVYWLEVYDSATGKRVARITLLRAP